MWSSEGGDKNGLRAEVGVFDVDPLSSIEEKIEFLKFIRQDRIDTLGITVDGETRHSRQLGEPCIEFEGSLKGALNQLYKICRTEERMYVVYYAHLAKTAPPMARGRFVGSFELKKR